MNLKTLFLVAALLGASLSPAAAQSGDFDASLNEMVIQIPKAGSPALALETTVYKPEGAGPFPLAIINHGKAFGKAREQARYRPAIAARYFLQRGYAVIVPMRQGFSNSGGNYAGAGCDLEGNGLAHAGDVKATLDYVTAQPWADRNNIVVLGQSHGGWTTLAFGAQAYPGVKALVNFAGGLRQEKCPGWEQALALGAGRYARNTRLPSLWFYGDNDSYFSTSTFRAMHAQYTAAGGQARLVAFGEFGSDAHHLFGSRAGQPVWQPEVTRLLAAVGLPSERQAKFAKYGTAGLTPLPPETDFAALENIVKLPHVKSAGRAGYQAYLTKLIPRAFAIGPDGAWGWADGGEDPLKRALDNCQRHSKAECRLYSVDDFVVWQ